MLLVKQRPRPAQLEHPLTARIGSAQDDPFHLPPSMEPALCSKSTWPSLSLSKHLKHHLKFVKHLEMSDLWITLDYFGRHIMSDARGAAASAFVVW
jgi:hypothetical protein